MKMSPKNLHTIFLLLALLFLPTLSINCRFDVNLRGAKFTNSSDVIDCGDQQFCVIDIVYKGEKGTIKNSVVSWNCGAAYCKEPGSRTMKGGHRFCCEGEGCNDFIPK